MISLTTADNALKSVYLEAITNQLNKTTDALYSKIDATSEYVSGNAIKKLVTLGMNGGIGAGSETGGLPASVDSRYALLTSTLKNIYGQVVISDKAIRASRDEVGAFINLLNAEMEALVDAGRFNLARILYGKGNGYLGYITDSEEDSAVIKVNNVYNMAIGMRIRALKNGTEQTRFSNAKIVDINYSTKSITLDVTMDSTNEDEPLDLYVYDAINGESIGFAGLCDSSITSVYGIDITTTSFLTPGYIQQASFTISTLNKAFDDASINQNANIDMVTCGYTFRRNVQNILKMQSLNTDLMVFDGGYKTISFMGIPINASRFVPDSCAYLIDSTVWHLHELCDWTWLTNNKGEVLHQKEGYPVHTATLVKYCDLICDRPETITMLKWGN